jgi:hypothetical protein
MLADFSRSEWVRSSHLVVTCGNGRWWQGWPQVKCAVATAVCGGLAGIAGGGCGPAFSPRVGVGDGQGQGFELGDQGAEPAVIVEPLPVVVQLIVGDEPGDGLAADLAGPLPVGAVQDGRVGVAAAAGLAAPVGADGDGAGQGGARGGEPGGDAVMGRLLTSRAGGRRRYRRRRLRTGSASRPGSARSRGAAVSVAAGAGRRALPRWLVGHVSMADLSIFSQAFL